MDVAARRAAQQFEHLRVARLDRPLLVLGDRPIVQRRAPVGRALEDRELSDQRRDGLDDLHARGAGADDGDLLAGEIHRPARPAAGMEGLPAEALDARNARQGVRRQRADGGDQEARAKALACLERHGPLSRGVVEGGRDDVGVALDVAAQVEPVGDVVQVAERFRLGGEMLAPVPLR